MNIDKLTSMNKFEYLQEFGDSSNRYTHKAYKKQANRISRHLGKRELRNIRNNYNDK